MGYATIPLHCILNHMGCHFCLDLMNNQIHYHGYTDTNTGWSSTYTKVTMIFVQPTVFMVFVIPQPYTSEVGLWVRVIRASRAQTPSRSVQYRITPYILYTWKVRYATNGGLGEELGAAQHPFPPENLKLYYQVNNINFMGLCSASYIAVFISALQIIITNTIIGLGFVAPNICTFSTP